MSATGPAPLAPEVGLSDGSTAVVVWTRLDPRRDRTLIEAAVRRPGRRFGPAESLAGAVRGVGHPCLAVSPRGRGLVVRDRPARGADSRQLGAAGWRLRTR